MAKNTTKAVKYIKKEIEERYEDSANYSDWQDYISMHC